MATFLALAFAFPTVIFTTLLLVMIGYWALVLLGAGGMEFGADGALEAKAGAVEGALEAKSGVLEGALGAKTGAIEALGAKEGMLAWLGIGSVPASVVLTALMGWAWTFSMIGSATLGPVIGGWLPAWLVHGGIGLLSAFLGVLLAGVSAKPLKPFFTVKLAPTRQQLLGKVATVATTRVDGSGRMGQATLEDGGAGLLLPVFCPRENTLRKSDRVLLLEYSEAKDAYEVEPVEWLLPEELARLDNPVAAEAIARAHLKQRVEP